jgi:hypothetical protein
MGNHELKKTVGAYEVEAEILTILKAKSRVNVLQIGSAGGVIFEGNDGKTYFIDPDDEGGFDAVFSEIKGGSCES